MKKLGKNLETRMDSRMCYVFRPAFGCCAHPKKQTFIMGEVMIQTDPYPQKPRAELGTQKVLLIEPQLSITLIPEQTNITSKFLMSLFLT